MKILLIQPRGTEEVSKEYVSLQYPINLGYIASVLIENSYDIKMVDFNVINPKKLPYFISKYQPDLVGLTTMTSSIYNVKRIVSEIKRINKKIITVLGGIHASALPVQTMKEIKDLDYLIFGEGEKTIVELVECIINKKRLNSVNGIVFRKKGKIIKNRPRALIENIDTIPFPARDLLPMELYSKRHVSKGFSRKDIKIIEIITSRGCPNNCIFCASRLNYGHRLRFRSYKNITNEIKECIEKYGITHISIEDDTFTINRNLVVKLCDFFNKKNLTWNCNARVNTVDYDLLKIMVKSGCKKISFGIESGNAEILKKIKKGITLPQTIKTVRNAKKAGIRYVECTFMIGSHIDETLDQVYDTFKLIYKLMPDIIMVSIMCPYPGTEIYKMMVDKKYLDKNPDWSQFSFYGDLKRYKRLTHLTTKQMSRLQHKILKEYYGSPKYILSQLAQIRSLKEIKYFFRMGITFIKEMVLKKY